MDTPQPDTPHRLAWDAIPWVLAGSASAEETRCVHEHLPHCADCQAEWALQAEVQAGLNAAVPARWPSPDVALQRLLPQLGGEGRPAFATGTAAAKAGMHAGPRTASPGWTRWLVAAVLVQAVALGASGLAWLRGGPPVAVWAANSGSAPGSVPGTSAAPSPVAGAGTDFRTLSSNPAAAAPATLRLVPAAGLDFAALQGLLVQTRLLIVEVAPDGRHLGLVAADGRVASALAALPMLRTHPGVRLAEPTAAAAATER